jgi:hypothetical protein
MNLIFGLMALLVIVALLSSIRRLRGERTFDPGPKSLKEMIEQNRTIIHPAGAEEAGTDHSTTHAEKTQAADCLDTWTARLGYCSSPSNGRRSLPLLLSRTRIGLVRVSTTRSCSQSSCWPWLLHGLTVVLFI